MKKRILLVLTVLTMLLCIPLIASAQIIDSGSCGADGDNVTWTLDDDGTLTIRGDGDMEDYGDDSSPFYNNSNIKSVIIENGVTRVGNFAFYNCNDLISIDIPDSLTSIGNYAFSSCGLKNIEIPENVSDIDYCAFYNSTSLEDINVNKKNKEYYSEDGVLFSDKYGNGSKYYTLYCYPAGKLDKSYDIPNGVEIIESDAFAYCSHLENITISSSVGDIDYFAFRYCTGIKEIIIPSNVVVLGNDAFFECTSLKKITIENGVKRIYDKAFVGTAIQTVYIPESVEEIGSGAFMSDNLQEIIVSENNSKYTSLDGILYTKDMKTLHTYPGGRKETEYSMIEGINKIEYCAFSGNSHLKHLIISDGVAEIGGASFPAGLLTVRIPMSVSSIGANVASGYSSFVSKDKNYFDVYYDGSEEDWEQIYINPSNSVLLELTSMHFNKADMTIPTISEVIFTKTGESRWVEENDSFIYKYSAKVSYQDLPFCAQLITAIYKGKQIVAIETETLSSNTNYTDISIWSEHNDAECVKVFLWECIDTMKPLCEAKISAVD